MTFEAEQNRSELLTAIVRSGARLKVATTGKVDRSGFLRAYYGESAAEDLTAEPRVLAAAALSHLGVANVRAAGKLKLRIYNPTATRHGYESTRTVIEMVNDDMPFLVDSLTMALNALGHPIRVAIHPIYSVRRDSKGRLLGLSLVNSRSRGRPESFIRFEIAKETQATVLKRIERQLRSTLRDVRAAVEDWQPMLEQLRSSAAYIRDNEFIEPAVARETYAFLDWLSNDNFTLLGYRENRLVRGATNDRLKAIAGTGLGILRDTLRRAVSTTLSGDARAEARSMTPLLITKADRRSTVHRPAQLDYISVKVFDRRGRPVAEQCFLGLFTSIAYFRNPREIPLLREKVERIMKGSGLDPRSHRGKALQHILDTFPRDDLFQSDEAELTRISLGILGLGERHKVSLFLRRDTFGRFYSCLVYLPRDQYSANARQRVEALLERGIGGRCEASRLTVSESALVRLELTILTDARNAAVPDTAKLLDDIEAAVRSWSDRVRQRLLDVMPEDAALELFHRFIGAFSAAYMEAVDARHAVGDMHKLAELFDGSDEIQTSLRAGDDDPGTLEFKIFSREQPIPLYSVMPILENMGLMVLSEDNHRVAVDNGIAWIQGFGLKAALGIEIDASAIEVPFRESFARVLNRDAEDDGFNSFVVSAALDWREAALLRAYCKYVLQISKRFSQSYMLEVLARYPRMCRALVDRFRATFDPDLPASARRRDRAAAVRTIKAELDRAVSLDDDRILRSFESVMSATLRTNYFQLVGGEPKTYISLKLDPKRIAELVRPRPEFEIFVYSPRVEGVHLRCGAIARGGLRWSDRREDFRTEVLGLMKAQQVKNTVIVPAGAKGGFVCKALPPGDRAALQAEVVDCYRTFIRGLLDVTDNVVAGQTVGPERVLCKDGPDPYLVVAADKGTASFSDIANEISREYAFWLGDAFASGGSAGYDHKKMAITARGAWVGVQRHFREIGVDVRNEEFTVVGIGDMGGDVFGNGMLLSRHIRLIAAFNHAHIFIDPDPDAKRSYKERRRLFSLRRSTWDDYRRDCISEGGGVYSRSAKSIVLHGAAQTALGISKSRVTPPELIRAMLTAKVDLLWNGGIGTYVKASIESHLDAADPANDALRVDGRELGCKVVGEGGNLGFTQLGRVEYALLGGRLNTDFIDNSAGVDSSDREVNIKILLNDAIARRRLAAGKRDALLAEMAETVAGMVLASNYAQTQSLSMLVSRTRDRLGEYQRLMRLLEARGLLDRTLEFLPSDDEIEERRKTGAALTRPELAVLLSYSKIELAAALIDTEVPHDRDLDAELESYFPEQIRGRFRSLIQSHPLRAEIVAMLISSSIINRLGPVVALRAEEETGASVAEVARAYIVVREVFGIRALWREIESLDFSIPAEAQYDSMFEISRMMRRAVYWFLQHRSTTLDIGESIDQLRRPVAELLDSLPDLLSGRARRRHLSAVKNFERRGLPAAVGERIAALVLMTQILDLVDLSRTHDRAPKDMASLYFELGEQLRIDWLRDEIEALEVSGRWRAVARAALRDTLANEQLEIVRAVLGAAPDRSWRAALSAWREDASPRIARLQKSLDEMRSTGEMDFATLSVALKEVGQLI